MFDYYFKNNAIEVVVGLQNFLLRLLLNLLYSYNILGKQN